MQQKPISLFFLSPPCNKMCATTNHTLHRWHATCCVCTTRKSLSNPKYKFDAEFGLCLPSNFDCFTSILNNGTGYILFYDLDARFGKVKRILLFNIFNRAERSRYTKIAKKLYSCCELLAV